MLFIEILIIHKHSLGSCEVHTNFTADLFSRFDVFSMQTDTDKQSMYIDTSVEGTLSRVCLNEFAALDMAGAPILLRPTPAYLATVNNDILSETEL